MVVVQVGELETGFGVVRSGGDLKRVSESGSEAIGKRGGGGVRLLSGGGCSGGGGGPRG